MATPARPAGCAAGFVVRAAGLAVCGGGATVCTGGLAVGAGGFAGWAAGLPVCAVAPDERATTKLNSSSFCIAELSPPARSEREPEAVDYGRGTAIEPEDHVLATSKAIIVMAARGIPAFDAAQPSMCRRTKD